MFFCCESSNLDKNIEFKAPVEKLGSRSLSAAQFQEVHQAKEAEVAKLNEALSRATSELEESCCNESRREEAALDKDHAVPPEAEESGFLGAMKEALEKVEEAVHSAVEKVEAAVMPETPAKAQDPTPSVVPPAPIKVTPVIITFEKDGKTVDVTFVSRPLGFTFRSEMKSSCCGTVDTGKFSVTKVTDKPALRDLKVGMVLKKIAGKDVPNKVPIAQMNEFVKKEVAGLPEVTPVIITFEKDGTTVDVTFESRPLGFAFRTEKESASGGTVETGRFSVTKVTDKPELKDLKLGMVLKKVAGKDVPNKVPIEQMNEFVKKEVEGLPEVAAPATSTATKAAMY